MRGQRGDNGGTLWGQWGGDGSVEMAVWGHCGDTVGTLWGQQGGDTTGMPGDIRVGMAVWGHCGDIGMGTLWGHPGDIQGMFWGHPGDAVAAPPARWPPGFNPFRNPVVFVIPE